MRYIKQNTGVYDVGCIICTSQVFTDHQYLKEHCGLVYHYHKISKFVEVKLTSAADLEKAYSLGWRRWPANTPWPQKEQTNG